MCINFNVTVSFQDVLHHRFILKTVNSVGKGENY